MLLPKILVHKSLLGSPMAKATFQVPPGPFAKSSRVRFRVPRTASICHKRTARGAAIRTRSPHCQNDVPSPVKVEAACKGPRKDRATAMATRPAGAGQRARPPGVSKCQVSRAGLAACSHFPAAPPKHRPTGVRPCPPQCQLCCPGHPHSLLL